MRPKYPVARYCYAHILKLFVNVDRVRSTLTLPEAKMYQDLLEFPGCSIIGRPPDRLQEFRGRRQATSALDDHQRGRRHIDTIDVNLEGVEPGNIKGGAN